VCFFDFFDDFFGQIPFKTRRRTTEDHFWLFCHFSTFLTNHDFLGFFMKKVTFWTSQSTDLARPFDRLDPPGAPFDLFGRGPFWSLEDHLTFWRTMDPFDLWDSENKMYIAYLSFFSTAWRLATGVNEVGLKLFITGSLKKNVPSYAVILFTFRLRRLAYNFLGLRSLGHFILRVSKVKCTKLRSLIILS